MKRKIQNILRRMGYSMVKTETMDRLNRLCYLQNYFILAPVITSRLNVPVDELHGICPVCGGEGVTFNGFSDNVRESGSCLACGASNRQRQMGIAVRKAYGLPLVGETQLPKQLRVHNTESTGKLHNTFLLHNGYTFSEFFGPSYTSGQYVNGVRHENLLHLSFASGELDLMLSSDVLEHMPSPYDAHAEIHRVLKRGGRHIFTVPFDLSSQHDLELAKLVDGEIVYLAPKQFHGDPVRPNEGILVWTIFGLDMLRRIEQIGFTVNAWKVYEPEFGIIGKHQLIFEAVKR